MELILYLGAMGAFCNFCLQGYWLTVYLRDLKETKEKNHLETISYNTLNTAKNTYFNNK